VKYHYQLFANYFQVMLEDDGDKSVGLAMEDAWTQKTVNDRLAIVPHGISISTARNMTVPVTVDVLDRAPEDDFSGWDHIVECSLEIASGRIVVRGCTDWYPDAARIPVTPGTYAVRIYYGGLDTIDDLGLEGDDHYRVVLWPGAERPTAVLKRHPITMGG